MAAAPIRFDESACGGARVLLTGTNATYPLPPAQRMLRQTRQP